MIRYTYTPSGQKIAQLLIDEDGRINTRRDYAGAFVYVNNDLAWVNTPWGRFVKNLEGKGECTDYIPEIHLRDHLGNTRVVLQRCNGFYNSTQIADYYPFGMAIADLSYSLPNQNSLTQNRYLYNGKELQDDFGLNWYDYGARFYDAQIGRFHTLDPWAEKYSFQSPFTYAVNNPVRYIDWMGLGPEEKVRTWNSTRETHVTYTADKNKQGSGQSTGTDQVSEVNKSGFQRVDEKGKPVQMFENKTTTTVSVDKDGNISDTATRTTVSKVTNYDENGKATVTTHSNTSTIATDNVSDNLKNATNLVSDYKIKNGESPVQTYARQVANQKTVESHIGGVAGVIGVGLSLIPTPKTQVAARLLKGTSIALGSGGTSLYVKSLFTSSNPEKIKMQYYGGRLQ